MKKMKNQNNNEAPEIRRTKGKNTRFFIDNELLKNGYASKFRKSHLLDVYSVIAMHANFKTQIAYPSIETIMRFSGVKNRNGVRKALKLLQEYNIIKIFSSKGRTSNRYILLDPQAWYEMNESTGGLVEPYQKQMTVDRF